MSSALDALRQFLTAAGPGRIGDEHRLIELLAAVWPSLDGADDEAMASSKVGRLEDPEWQPPLLTFRIERHGALVLGGTRADMQTWTVDLNHATATPTDDGYRQLVPRAAPLKVEPLVAEIVELVAAGAADDRLKWSPDRGTVRIIIGKAIPDDGFQRTVAGRRKRLRGKLGPALGASGWNPGAVAWTYVRADHPSSA